MSRHRLFVPQPISGDQELTVEGELGHYLSRVLRLKPGNAVTLFDGSGQEYPSIVLEAKRQLVLLRTGQAVVRDVESRLALRLIQAVSRGDRMDFVVQKATELGVNRLSPVLSEFSVVKLNAERAARRSVDTKRSVALDPMNARDRRILHMAVRDLDGVATMSVGSGRYRQVVIVPEGSPEYEEARASSSAAAARDSELS